MNPGATRLLLTATSSNGSLVPTTGLVFSGTGSTRSLQITPTPDLGGNTQITVTVEDGGMDANLSTSSDNQRAARTFTVTVNP